MLIKRYGITAEDYDRMVAGQNGVCRICERPPAERTRLFVDHCHRTGRVRGLLCNGCNAGLGHFEDDVQRLKEAAEYLSRSSARV